MRSFKCSNKARTDITNQNNSTSIQSIFQIKHGNIRNLCLQTPNKYAVGEYVTTSYFEFSKRLANKIGEFIDDEFDWSNIIIAGGLISGMVESKPDIEQYVQSDIDIFIYGGDIIVTNTIQRVYEYFLKKLNKKFYAFVYIPGTSIVSIIIPGKCAIQIIGTRFVNPIEVLQSFDLTHCQVGFDGTKLLYTKEFIEAVSTRITKITKPSIHAYRLVKTYLRGYSIEKPDYCFIKNTFHEYTSDPLASLENTLKGLPTPKSSGFSNTDKIYDINNLQNIIDELAENPIVKQNLTKNYVPEINSNKSIEEEMKKMGILYAGVDKYLFVNDCGNNIFIESIIPYIKFVKTPFLC